MSQSIDYVDLKMNYLSNIDLVDRGDMYVVFTNDEDGLASILDFTWMDRYHQYFIASCSTLNEGKLCVR